MAGQVYAVASGKGGVGKTTTVVNLGVVLRQAGHTVALVDADLGMANLGTMLGIDAESTLHDVLAGEATLKDALVEEAPGFGVLVGSTDLMSYPSADPSDLGDILADLAAEYEYVLVDTGAGMSWEDVLPLGLADRIILVTSPEPTAAGDTHKTAELAELAEGTIEGLVVTMAHESIDARYVGSQVGAEVIGVIPFDPAVRRSTASSTPLEGLDPDSQAAEAYRELAARLTDETVEPPPREPAAESTADESVGDQDAQAVEATPSEPAESAQTNAAVEEAESERVPAAGDDSEATTEAGTITRAGEADHREAETDTPASDAATSGASGPGDAGTDRGEPAVDEPADESPDSAEGASEAPEVEADTRESPVEEAETPEEAAEEDQAVQSDDAVAEEEPEDYLAEFEDEEPESSGGILARLGRLFR